MQYLDNFAIMFRSYGFLSLKDFKLFGLFNLLTLGVHEEVYCRDVSCTKN